eukprot:g3120.t1
MSVKFSYFDAEGRGEHCRLALSLVDGLDWEDDRFDYASYKEMKAAGKYPLGAPVLTVNGEEIGQSHAILRWTCRQVKGLYPLDDPFLCLKIDSATGDAYDALDKCPHSSDAEEKKKKREEYAKSGKLFHVFTKFNKHLEKTGTKFLVCDQLTMADLSLLMVTRMLRTGQFDYIQSDYTDGFPALAKVEKAIMEHDKVKAWFAKKDAK